MTAPVAMPGGDAFPLMKAGSTTIGQNTGDDFAKLFFQGLLFAPGASGYVRSGVLARGNFAANAPLELKVLENGNAQSVLVNPGLFVLQRGNITPPDRGVRWGGALGTTPIAVNMPAASGANSRYDGVYARIVDKNITQDSASPLTNNGPYIDVISGTVGGSLNINATPGTAGAPPVTPDGYLPLAYVARPTSDNTIAQADIADVRRGAMIAGTPRVMFPYDIANLTTDVGRMPGEERWRPIPGNGYPAFLDRWDGTTWRGTRSVRFGQPTQTFSGSLAPNASASMASAKLTIPWPGFPYTLTVLGQVQFTSAGNGELAGEINLDSDLYTPPPPTGGSAPPATALGWATASVYAGGRGLLTVDARGGVVSDGISHVVSFWVWAGSGNPMNMNVEFGYSYKFLVEITPI